MNVALDATYKGWGAGINAGGGDAKTKASMKDNTYEKDTFRTVVRMMIHVWGKH
jgi:hypothetical protein